MPFLFNTLPFEPDMEADSKPACGGHAPVEQGEYGRRTRDVFQDVEFLIGGQRK